MHLWAWQGDSSVCSCISTKPMYLEYKSHVLRVQKPCTFVKKQKLSFLFCSSRCFH